MCGCDIGYTCPRCVGTPDDPGYEDRPDYAADEERARYAQAGCEKSIDGGPSDGQGML